MELADKLILSEGVQNEINRRIGLLDSYELNWEGLVHTKDKSLLQLRQMATIESVGSSTRIEGSTLTDAEVNTLLKGLHIQQLETRDDQEVVGYYEVLDLIETSNKDMPLSQSMIFQLHRLLLKYSDKDQRHRGTYKNLSNKVVANYPDGSQRTIFRTTEPHLTEPEMYKLLTWTNEALQSKKPHPIKVIGLFVYEFLSIHPFQDGNGRLSRLITTLLLLQNGYSFIQYISFENYVEAHKDQYYTALMNGQKTRHSNVENIEEWMLFFTGGLVILTEKLNLKLEALKPLTVYLTDRHKKILKLLEKMGVLKISDIAKVMKKEKLASLKKDMAYLVNNGKIVKVGELKGSVYRLK